MQKSEAIRRLGGTNASAARAIGITPAAVSQWPDPLPDRIADRVLAAEARMAAAAAEAIQVPGDGDENVEAA